MNTNPFFKSFAVGDEQEKGRLCLSNVPRDWDRDEALSGHSKCHSQATGDSY